MPNIVIGKNSSFEISKHYGLTQSFAKEVSNGLLTIKSSKAHNKIMFMLDRLMQFSDAYIDIYSANRV